MEAIEAETSAINNPSKYLLHHIKNIAQLFIQALNNDE